MSVPYEQDLSGSFPDGLRSLKQARAAYSRALSDLRASLARLRADHAAESRPHWELPARLDDLPGIETVAERLRRGYRDVVVLATGGSSLGGRALCGLADRRDYNGGTARLRFVDNLDPHGMDLLLSELDLARTAFVVISKSGATGETVAQALVCLDALRRTPGVSAPAEHFFMIVGPEDSPLSKFGASNGIDTLLHDPDLGGRYSVLSSVGLLPARIAGLDIAAVRDGARSVLEKALEAAGPEDVPAAQAAALAVALARTTGGCMNVLLPYCDRLDAFALWHRQLWAESLGKNGQGMTPIRGLGPVDQHSQLQLYLEGPADKLFTVLCLETRGTGPRVPATDAGLYGAKYLGGATIGDFVAAQQDATIATLVRRGRPTRVLRLSRLDERTIGALFLHFMLETVFAADLLGVNPFDQPAVEEGKILARELVAERAAAGAVD